LIFFAPFSVRGKRRKSTLKNTLLISTLILKSLAVLFSAAVIISCDKKMDVIKKSDILSLPSLTRKNFETVYTDSAKLMLILSSPLMERYTNGQLPYSEFRNGIKVLFYDGHNKPVASFTSKYARLAEDTNIWELRDSVIAVNEKNERLETELLFWDQKKELVYTDRAVRISSEDEIVLGIGLESNPRFTNWWIKNVSATISI
jgi:LPS export ABC transporter protein LptC